MKNKRQLLFRIGALVILLAIAAAMFVVGRGHTIYFDNKTVETGGQTVEAFYKVNVLVGKEQAAKLSSGDRGMTDIMGQTLSMTLEITDEKGGSPRSQKVSMGIPYSFDGVVINIPALMAGLPEEDCVSEFVIETPQEEEEEEAAPGGEEFEMGDI